VVTQHIGSMKCAFITIGLVTSVRASKFDLPRMETVILSFLRTLRVMLRSS
jgi:hypothetical protein